FIFWSPLLSLRLPCFFSRYADRRHLPSFPTRRSSDLDLIALVSRIAWELQEEIDEFELNPVIVHADNAGYTVADALMRRRPQARSEEHTSELQSRENLVCRLLLEKKKPSHRTTHPRPR